MADGRTSPSQGGAQTPLTEQEQAGLLLPLIDRGELDHAEAENIAQARLRMLRPSRPVPLARILTVEWMRRLHKAMFGEVWGWAGRFRTTERNLGVEPWRIPAELRTLVDDVTFWVAGSGAGSEVMSPDEIGLRLSHRAVVIHPFPNGNGRWSRLLADAVALAQGRPAFTWGGSALRSADELRHGYLEALRIADRELRYDALIEFARS
jgi:Fic-DOC domain mobile mystery protein B